MRALVTAGSATRRRSRYEPLRTIALAASCLAFLLSLGGVGAALATEAGWNDRSFERAIRPAAFFPEEEPAFLWYQILEHTDRFEPFSVVYITPLRDGIDPPPGLDSWLAEGEIVISPAMADRPLTDRYGRPVGTIGSDGLVEDGELLVYVGGGARLTEANARVATGWGSEFGDRVGSDLYRAPLSHLLWLLTLLAVAPSAWFFITSLRIGGSQRARRVEVVRLLGAQRGHLRRLLWGEARTPILTAWAMTAGVFAVALVIDLPLPFLGFTLRSEDVRGSWSLVLAWVVVGVALTAMASVSAVGLKTERRQPPAAPRATWLRACAAPVAAALGLIAVNLAVAAAAIDVVPVAFGATMLATVVLLPMSTRSWLILVAQWGRRRAWLAGEPGAMTGAAQLAAAAAPASRFGATAAILIILVAFVYSFAQALGGARTHAEALRAQIGDDVATVTAWVQADPQAWEQALDALRTEYAVVEVRVDHSVGDGVMSFTGARADLDRMSLSNGDVLPRWVDPGAVGEIRVEISAVLPPVEAPARSLVMARHDNAAIDREGLKDALATHTVPTWNGTLPGDEWMVGTHVSLEQSRWISWLGAVGVMLALCALWVSYSNELLRASRSLLAVQVLAPDGRFVLNVLTWRVLAPVCVAVLGGSGLTLVLIAPLTTADYQLPLGFVTFCAVAAIGTGGVALAVTVRACTRAALSLSVGIPEE